MLCRFMNVAALLCASILDLFRIKLRHGFNIDSLPDNHVLNDGNRLLLLMGVSQEPQARTSLLQRSCLQGCVCCCLQQVLSLCQLYMCCTCIEWHR